MFVARMDVAESLPENISRTQRIVAMSDDMQLHKADNCPMRGGLQKNTYRTWPEKLLVVMSMPPGAKTAPNLLQLILDDIVYQMRVLVVRTTESDQRDFGHFITYVLVGESWWRVDDAVVRRVHVDDVKQAQAYLIGYEKQAINEPASCQQQQPIKAHQAKSQPPEENATNGHGPWVLFVQSNISETLSH